jgi:hypothetical protein
VNYVVELVDDRRLVPPAVHHIEGDDGEQHDCRKFEPMIGDLLHVVPDS